eukprot:3278743-Pyramimonas_sp.AAC.1
MIEQRMNVLIWMFNFVGLPFAPCVIVARLRQHRGPIDPGALIQVADEAGRPAIGVIKGLAASQTSPMQQGSKMFVIPPPQDGGRHPASLRLQTSIEQEQEMMTSVCGGAIPWTPAAAASSVASVASSLGVKRVDNNVTVVKAWLLSVFGSHGWADLIQERHFTSKITLVNNSRYDPGSVGNKTVENACNAHLAGGTRAKCAPGRRGNGGAGAFRSLLAAFSQASWRFLAAAEPTQQAERCLLGAFLQPSETALESPARPRQSPKRAPKRSQHSPPDLSPRQYIRAVPCRGGPCRARSCSVVPCPGGSWVGASLKA